MMQAGKYYIGDLCYVMQPEWDEFCYLTIKGNDCLDGEFTLKDGRRIASYGTMFGDGTYRSNIGTEHAVDAGLIGCIRVEDISEDLSEDDLREYGAIVDFDADFSTDSENGTIRFGSVEIYTADEDEYECEDDDYSYEDE